MKKESKSPLRKGCLIFAALLLALVALPYLFLPRASICLGRSVAYSESENAAHNLKNAVAAFFTEYQRYPTKSITSGGSATIDSNRKLMSILLADESGPQDTWMNPRKIVFYAGKSAKRAWGGKYKKGIHLKTQTLWDPWGNLYRMRLDTNFDNQIEDPENAEQMVPASILVWSAGKDGDFDTWKDNVKTW